jgi:flagellar biosynthetic protein FliR
MLEEIIQADLFAFFLVFTRVGAAMTLMPGFGESYMSPRFRLMIALGIALVVTPIVSATLPALPASPFELFLVLGGEMVIGLFLGAIARILFAALQSAGMVIAYEAGMANAFVTDPTAASQGALFGAFLGVLGVVVIFETGLHYHMLSAVVDSYTLFAPGQLPPLDDYANTIARVFADSFELAIRIAAPFIVVALTFYLGLGLLGRLMPQIHVFFIALPLQIMLGFIVLALTVVAGMTWFLGTFEETIAMIRLAG